ncbi:MAG: lamin tail domain-containing protein [Caldilineaceae bacterium]|nr:lamin tail domain-containing protein [Caldilineaceae bacterium]
MARLHSSIGRVRTVSPKLSLRAHRLFASFALALFFFCTLYSVAAAQIVLDGFITEPDWHVLGTSQGGPAPVSPFGPGDEINALAAEIDANYFYVGVAGNVLYNKRILVFIDSRPGGKNNGDFGRTGAPQGLNNFNPATLFDVDFTPDYVLVISTDSTQQNYFWELFTLSGTFATMGGSNLPLGDRNNPNLRASPANGSQIQGFEARLSYLTIDTGVGLVINQPEIRMMAMYIRDDGFLSNQFISHAISSENRGNGQIFFNVAPPDPVRFGNMLVINEVDYVMPGENNAEFIEIKNITNLSVNLDPYRLRFARNVNNTLDVYREIDLPNINLSPGDYFVVCTNPAHVPNCDFTILPPIDLLENVVPAAVALWQNEVIVDAVSYGGNTIAPYTEGAGVLPTDDGTAVGLGISRVVDGMDTNRNNVDFGLRCVTPGQPNNTPTTGCGPVTSPTFTPTWTPTATGTPTPTGSPTPTATGSVAPPPSGCTNILVNGDFESAYGWEFGGSPIPGKYTSIPVHSGIRAVQLGITPESGYAPVYTYSSVRQAVSIPRGATVQLRWWHYHKTELPVLDSTNNTQDRQEVILLKPNGDTLRVLQRVRRNDGNWQQTVLDLTEYAGQSFVLYFNVINYGAGRTWTFIDDAELLVCMPQGGYVPYGQTSGAAPYSTALLTPTPTPTASQMPTVTPTNTGAPAQAQELSAAELTSPTPTVTPTNTGAPSPTPSPTSTTMPTVAVGPGATENTFVQQAVPTPTVVLVANHNIVPDGCTELIKNGGFEALGMGWSHEGSRILPEYSIPADTTDIALQANMAIRLGLVGDHATNGGVSGISAAQQLVQLPADAKRIGLSFRYFTLYETPPSTGDFQYVDIYHGSTGQFLGRVLGIQQNERTWLTRSYDLSALAGEEIRLFFMVSNDGVGGNIAMYVDDVSVLACRTNGQAPLNTLAAAPVEQPAQQSVQQPLPTPVVSTPAPFEQLGARTPAEEGSPFGRVAGLLAVMGIAGAALLIFPLIRRSL